MKRLLTSIFAGVIVFGLVAAFAATLNVNAGGLGASEVTTVDSCDDGVSLSYGTAFVAGEYKLTSLTVSELDGTCTTISATFGGESFDDEAIAGLTHTFTLAAPVSAEGFSGPVDIVVSS